MEKTEAGLKGLNIIREITYGSPEASEIVKMHFKSIPGRRQFPNWHRRKNPQK